MFKTSTKFILPGRACFCLALLGLWLVPLSPRAQSSSSAPAAVVVDAPRRWDFAASGVHFSTEFSSARLNACQELDGGKFRLAISPENTPINPSVWYAFKVWADQPRVVTLEFTNTYFHTRFGSQPRLSHDGVSWKIIGNADFDRFPDTHEAVARLKVGPQPLWVASHEIIGVKELGEWTDRMRALPFARGSVIGETIEKRPMRQFTVGETTNASFVFIIGRQHPPEVTGSLGLMSFAEAVAGSSPLAREFRRHFQTVIIPLMNPDGVAHGHWRHNLGGVDLNRHWADFQQPEIAAARDFFNQLAARPGAREFLFLDFHTTGTNVFYVQPDPAVKTSGDFPTRWLAAIRTRCPEFGFKRDDGHNLESDTAKAWASGRFGIPSITCEFGGGTDRKLIRRAGGVEAEEMMKLLLAGLKTTPH